jgi:two-component sensor histidine kinase
VYLDRDFNFLWVNAAYAEACRRRPEEFLGHNHFEFYPHEENEAIFAQVRDTGEAAVWREKPFVFPDQPERGTTYWDWTLTPLKGEAGEVESLVFALVEVTEKVRAREDRIAAERARAEMAETIAAEINHRMKNNLMLLSGLMEMQLASRSAGSAAEEELRQAITRISAMSVVHEHLYEGRSGSVEAKDMFRRIAEIDAQALAGEHVDIAVTGDTVFVPSKAGSTLAVLMNELVTNAIKHGHPGPNGRLAVEIQVTQGQGELEISVWNSGTPGPERAGAGGGMGLQLVRGVVSQQLGGSFLLRARDGGTVAKMRLDERALAPNGLETPAASVARMSRD